ncbi:hypothetical protein N7478_000033 [Penicillium angulare]|uniref:uncharacterized protein n=1 Tax=Penicillium angulare TaxID=116970 RepID=UPI0025407E91|nr:uncharacterized protein N7478_000033 [Penicillium angulare]KAJ5290782.1 hypothetical protein N7478_000033 [Penicillium angulare]
MADYLQFADPFWENPPSDTAPKNAFQHWDNIAMAPISSMPMGTAELSIVGQGTIAVNSKTTDGIEFCVSTGTSYPKLILKLTQHSATFYKKEDAAKETLLEGTDLRPESSRFIPSTSPKDGTVYWLSIDRSNWVLRYGKYYTSKWLTLVEVKLDDKKGEWLEQLTTVKVDDSKKPTRVMGVRVDPNIKISRLPVTLDLPPIVVSNEAVTLRRLDFLAETSWVNLPNACQNLYHNISGEKISLDAEPEFQQLAEAIHKSVTTPGLWGHNKLKSKCKNPTNPDPKEFVYKYLRITIGSNKGNSPGIPYVMEVWPPGHKSPIHDHGDACAVIRVLSGTIQCTWYDTLVENVDPIMLGQPVALKKDQITWLGENQYQIHALENKNDETCITLQCYEYPKDNDVHEEKFRFIETSTKAKDRFTPNSDSTFTEFYQLMKDEWHANKSG